MAEAAMRGALSPILAVEDLHVYYGHAHALQGVTLVLDRGVLAVLGRNGMGKTTLCNAIMGLVAAERGRIRLAGEDVLGLPANEIVDRGVGYVPQGRRVWPSLSVDEHLRVAARGRRGKWTIERVYETFPRLAERRRNGGAELSGGEQQMLAIGRSLLADPRLLVMDEPTEGLAPVIVAQVEDLLKRLAAEGEIAVLLIEQNLGVATSVADRIAIMVNGRVARSLSPAELEADRDLQQRLLGVRSAAEPANEPATPSADTDSVRVYTIRRAEVAAGGESPAAADEGFSARGAPTRWSREPASDGAATNAAGVGGVNAPAARVAEDRADPIVAAIAPVPVASTIGRVAYVAGTFDTKARELSFLKSCIEKLGLRAVGVDLSTSRRPSPADISPNEVARHHPKGAAAVFTGDRGTAVTAMAEAFERFMLTRRDVGGIISAGGSGGTSLATPAMRALPVGVPKVMVSTVASGNVSRYVGPSDICMMYSVTDIQGINRISDRVLSNAAHALAGMIAHRRPEPRNAKPAIGLTMFGVTTPCVQAVARALEGEYDCLVFHATGTGGQSMEKLADSGLLAGVIDVTTTEVADLLMGGVFPATEDRFGAVIRTRVPYVGSCGALDMVNWGSLDTVPSRFRARNLYQHNPQVTLMRTTAEENSAMGRWIGERLNRMDGPVRFIIPEGGVSMLDAPGRDFWDPEADRELFSAIEQTVKPSATRRLVKSAHNLNDPAFAELLVQQFRDLVKPQANGGSHAPHRARAAP